MMRARSCWRSGSRLWIAGTHSAQRRRKGVNTVGQLERERLCRGADFSRRGRGTEGGEVVLRSAAKYRHNAGPTEVTIRS
jgi:hypothetical protein